MQAFLLPKFKDTKKISNNLNGRLKASCFVEILTNNLQTRNKFKNISNISILFQKPIRNFCIIILRTPIGKPFDCIYSNDLRMFFKTLLLK